jgi:hypothetical protein
MGRLEEGTVVDRGRVREEKSRLYGFIAVNFMDLACLDEETEGLVYC